MSPSRTLRNVIIFMVNAAILIFSFRWFVSNIQVAELTFAFQQVSPISWAGIAIINLLVLIGAAFRLYFLTGISPSVALKVTSLGAGLNGLLPFRMGDVAKIFYSKTLYGIPATQLIAASFTEKLLDLAALLFVVGVIFLGGGSQLIGAKTVTILALCIGIGLLVLCIFIRYAQKLGALLIDSELLRTAILSFRRHLRIRYKVPTSLATAFMWSANLLVVYVGLKIFLPEVGVSFLDASAILLIIALAIAVPSAPAGLGVFEAGVVSYLTIVFHLNSEKALVAALLLHLAISLPAILFSIAIILRVRQLRV